MDGHHSLYLMVGELREKVQALDVRVRAIEQQKDTSSGMGVLGMIKRAAGLKEWVFVISIGALAVKGILTPEDVKALILNYFGG